MENKLAVLLCGLFLLVGIFATIGFTNNDAEVIYLNRTVFVPGELEIVYVDKPIQNDEVFNKLFTDEIKTLEDEGLDCFTNEFDENDVEDALEDLINGSEKANVRGNGDLEVEVLNLGLDEDEDKLVKVSQEFEVKYELGDSYDKLKATIVAEGTVTFDEEDGFECEIVYSLK